MRKKVIITAIKAIFIFPAVLNAQSTNLGNVRIPGAFVGWNGAGFPGDLQVRNNFNQPINLFTNNLVPATVTTNSAMNNGGFSTTFGGIGDGIRIAPGGVGTTSPSAAFASLT